MNRWMPLVALAALTVLAPARAQPAPDPVERLRAELRTAHVSEAVRDRALGEAAAGVRSLGDLRRALLLPDWGAGTVDSLHQMRLADRLAEGFREVLRAGDADTQRAALDLLTQMASGSGKGTPLASVPRQLAPDLARLTADGTPRNRYEAARALGRVHPEVSVARPALEALAAAPDWRLRLGALEGLSAWVETSGGAVDASNPGGEAAPVAAAVLPVAAKSLVDAQPEVRRRAALTVEQAAGVLSRGITVTRVPVGGDRYDLEAARRSSLVEWEGMRPLVCAARDVLPAVAGSLRDADADTRLAIQRTLEELAAARGKWRQLGEVVRTLTRGESGNEDADPLGDGLRKSIVPLGLALGDKDVRVRRAALDVLETLGPDAAPAAPAVTRVLKDDDKFVRWGAVRTLRAIGSPAARPAVPFLTRLLQDPEVDIRATVVETLRELDPDGQGVPVRSPRTRHSPPKVLIQTPVPALVQSLASPEMPVKLAAMRTLGGMGENARPAVGPLRAALGSSDARVRLVAVESLGDLGPVAREALEDLRKCLRDPDEQVRKAASEAVLSVMDER